MSLEQNRTAECLIVTNGQLQMLVEASRTQIAATLTAAFMAANPTGDYTVEKVVATCQEFRGKLYTK